ncbi:succinate dehydrogenase cytochrome b558 subunit [Indiicoccus explosivorum]|uniref:succinate dehydrogenase cytochrome b558 subunit n=1 Tax=Indiicoccus explosivorum TaxID=1917864 RepID=UPI000B44F947|nr:succinate dehydrogenase cytochrome b558 subunit [Indiicoccus explosivorum]
MTTHREFFLRRLHSLLGVIPVGVFLTQHLFVNNLAVRGPEAFEAGAHFLESLPFRYFLEIFVIFLPLMYHAFYGLYIAFTAKNNPKEYGYLRNWAFVLQRYTGVFLVIFIAWHVYETRWQAALGAEVNFNMMAEILSNPWMVAFYVLGVITATFHFANGIWSFLVSWGITQSPGSQRVATVVTMLFFVVLSVIGVQAVFAFV